MKVCWTASSASSGVPSMWRQKARMPRWSGRRRSRTRARSRHGPARRAFVGGEAQQPGRDPWTRAYGPPCGRGFHRARIIDRSVRAGANSRPLGLKRAGRVLVGWCCCTQIPECAPRPLDCPPRRSGPGTSPTRPPAPLPRLRRRAAGHRAPARPAAEPAHARPARAGARGARRPCGHARPLRPRPLRPARGHVALRHGLLRPRRVALLDHLESTRPSSAARCSVRTPRSKWPPRARAAARDGARDARARQRAARLRGRLHAADGRAHGRRAADEGTLARPRLSPAARPMGGRPPARHGPPGAGPERRRAPGDLLRRTAPHRSERRTFTMPSLVIGHRRDPVHPFSDAGLLAEELPDARLLEASSIIELRVAPDRLTAEIADSSTTAGGRARPGARSARGTPLMQA